MRKNEKEHKKSGQGTRRSEWVCCCDGVFSGEAVAWGRNSWERIKRYRCGRRNQARPQNMPVDNRKEQTAPRGRLYQ